MNSRQLAGDGEKLQIEYGVAHTANLFTITLNDQSISSDWSSLRYDVHCATIVRVKGKGENSILYVAPQLSWCALHMLVCTAHVA